MMYPYPIGLGGMPPCNFYQAPMYNLVAVPQPIVQYISPMDIRTVTILNQYRNHHQIQDYLLQKNTEYQEKAEITALRIQEVVAKEEIKESAAERKMMRRSDLEALKELQGKEVHIFEDGRVQYIKETFSLPLKREFPFLIKDRVVFVCDGIKEKVLAIGYIRNDVQGGIYLWTDLLEDRIVNRKFNEAGIHAGYSRVKESDFRQKLIQKCLISAHEERLPEKAGWNRWGEEVRFIDPDALTWRKVVTYAGKRN